MKSSQWQQFLMKLGSKGDSEIIYLFIYFPPGHLKPALASTDDLNIMFLNMLHCLHM